jgi:AcrR family transcriptional regulator
MQRPARTRVPLHDRETARPTSGPPDNGSSNGAFYAHFASKEDLVANVLADRCAPNAKASAPSPRIARGSKRSSAPTYLSPEHRDQRAAGCPSAALLDEIARRPAATRQVFTDELMGVIDDIASRLDPTDAEAARTDALTIFGHDRVADRPRAARRGRFQRDAALWAAGVRARPDPRRPRAASRHGLRQSTQTTQHLSISTRPFVVQVRAGSARRTPGGTR